MAEIKEKKLTQAQFFNMSHPFALDLIAMYSQMQEDMFKLVDKAEKEHWTAERLIDEIGNLI